MKYSHSTGCFYPDDLKYQTRPIDLIPVSADEYSSAMSRPPNDLLDVRGGRLVIVPAVPPTLQHSLAVAKLAQTDAINEACSSAITCGVASMALGALHRYPSGLTDQANLNANVVSSLIPGAWGGWSTLQMCCDLDGVWAYRLHSATQIQRAGIDVKDAILSCLTKADALRRVIAEASTIEAVQAITW